MKHAGFSFAVIMLSLGCLNAQTKAGLMRDNVVLQGHDTIAIAYPSGEAIIIAVLLDANNTIIGTTPVQWSVNGTLRIIDTPYISNKVLIDASLAMTDQKGYVIAQAASSDVVWVSNKVFVKIKGKNSGILQRNVGIRTKEREYPTSLFSISGRAHSEPWIHAYGIQVFWDQDHKIFKQALRLK